MNTIRCFDVLFSFLGLVLLSPVFFVIAIAVKLGSKGPVFYRQTRVGKNGKDFKVWKFRSMFTDADKKGLLTVGGKDNRITAIGFYLRKFKLDELPQLANVLTGQMSMVGPRPEVRKYVDLYTIYQMQALKVAPGITDYASIKYRNENELLALAAEPEEYYINEILPQKIELNFKYINNRTVKQYFKIITTTVATSLRGK